MFTDNIRKKNNAIKIVLFLSLILGFSQNIIGPLIPILTKTFSIGYDQIGLILFIGLFFGMFSTFFSGRLSDKHGRKPLILFGGILFMLALVGIVSSDSKIIFTISYIAMNIGLGALETGLVTGTAELGAENRSKILASYTVFLGIGSFIGPVILFIILFFNLWWKIIFLLIMLSIFILMVLFLKNKHTFKKYPIKHKSLNLKNILNPVVLSGAAVLFFHNGVVVTFGAWITTYFSSFEIQISFSTVIVAFYWLSVLIGRILTQKIIAKLNEKSFIISISLLSFSTITLIAFIDNILIKAVCSFFLGIFLAGIYPILLSTVLSTLPDAMGNIFSYLGFIGYGSVMIFQLVNGFVAENFGPGSVIFVQLINSFLSIVFICLMVAFRILREKNTSGNSR